LTEQENRAVEIAEAISESVRQRVPKKESGGIAPTKKKSIAILTPTLGRVSMLWTVGMLDLIWPMNCGRAFLPARDAVGDEIGEMRNKLVMLAIQSAEAHGIDMEYVFWLDDDVLIHRAVLLALASHDTDIASGVYFSKTDPSEALIFDGPSSGTAKFLPNNLMEKWGWSNGLCLIRTAVYKRMMDELDLGADKYGNPNFYKNPVFGVTPKGELNLGGTEDFHFFENASRLGYRPVVDCTLPAFGWHFDLATMKGYPETQFNQWLRREPVVWPQKGGGEIVWA
jgi:hypothetical protein